MGAVDEAKLCLLSLDGGGVRGLSTLYILKVLMDSLNNERENDGLPPVKPCEIFDLIGGTSTGGLIAIMLGRLQMNVDECILEYKNIMKAVFERRASQLPIGLMNGLANSWMSWLQIGLMTCLQIGLMTCLQIGSMTYLKIGLCGLMDWLQIFLMSCLQICLISWLPLRLTGSLPINWTSKIRARFDSKMLEGAIKEVITRYNASERDLFDDGSTRDCRVFVCATAKEINGIRLLKSYRRPDQLGIHSTICDAALATSAMTGFFDPVFIGPLQFVSGVLGANNPVDEVEGEASNIWCPQTGDLKPLVKCFISIGTGNPGTRAIKDSMLGFLSETLESIATETEHTERKFMRRWARHYREKRYFRFNVNGLGEVGLAEYNEEGKIEAATGQYFEHQDQMFNTQDCIRNLR